MMEEREIEEAVDPRVKDQLEYLNSYTDEINSLELQLDDANATFRNTLSEYSQILKQLAKKLGKCVQVARPYFDAEEASQKTKLECEEAAIRYHRACGIHKEARETIALTEGKFNDRKEEYEFNAAWQEMLNRETRKLIDAESLKEKSEKDHQQVTRVFAETQQLVKNLEHKLKKDIAKARVYFEQKKIFLRVLQDLKSRVESLQKAVIDSKSSYANCLHNLEMISKEIHDRRKLKLPPREPGVGAEGEVAQLSDISIYPLPISDIHLTDTESEKTEGSLSSLVESDVPDDIKAICSEEFKMIRTPIISKTKMKFKLRAYSEPCFPSRELLESSTKVAEGDDTNPNSDDNLLSHPSSSDMPSTSHQDHPEVGDSDVFEEVDLS